MHDRNPFDDEVSDPVVPPSDPSMPEHFAPLAPWGGDEVARFLKGDQWAGFVDEFRPTEYELGILAKHFLDVGNEMTLFERTYETYGSSHNRRRMAAGSRLDTIERALGPEKFAAAIAKREAEWKQKFADTEKQEQALAPCTKCGAKRYLSEVLLCGSAGKAGLCGACSADYWAELGPCANCGCQRQGVGGEYTGDLCEQCYVERLAPCANCGGKRDMRRTDSALCYECLSATIAPCKYCGATRHRYEIHGEVDHGYCHGCTL